MLDSLGIIVPSDKLGILQDIHWSAGLFGYFPTYSLGAIISTQLYEKIELEIPNFHELIQTGQFSIIREWLRKNIHEIGSLYAHPDDLLVHATGKPLDPKIYTKYLKKKYTELYKIK